MKTRQLPSGTVTLLFTDIEGSTRLLQELGGDAYVRALTDHRRLLREAFTNHGGIEVEMQGDSFHYAFSSARDAVAAALAGQRALHNHSWESRPIKVRIGLNTGEPAQVDGLYSGLDVHRAARVMSVACGGQVLASDRTASLVADDLPTDAPLVDLGLHQLKDLIAPEHLHQVGPGDFPPLNTASLHTNLPLAASELVGRAADVEELVALLRSGARIVSVTGPGGVGKTRLALEAAAEVGREAFDGVFWVPLAGLREPDLLLASIAQAVGARTTAADHLATRQVLLLLDNFEHLLPAAADVAALLSAAPRVTALVTSRAPLRIEGERVFRVEGLDEDDAVKLLVERSRAAGSEIAPDDVAKTLCRRLDNLPLALELAAARTPLFSPPELLQRLEQGLSVLTAGRRDAPPRQRTLRATIAWSYDLLDPWPAELFAGLAVFLGGFSLDAAESVCGADSEALASLVDLSLVRRAADGRFLMFETIREFALERPGSSGREPRLRRRHATYFRDFFEGVGPFDVGPQALQRLDAERDNLRGALEWTLQTEDVDMSLELAISFAAVTRIRGPLTEAMGWLTAALNLSGGSVGLRTQALTHASAVAQRAGDLHRAREWGEQALTLARCQSDSLSVAAALKTLAVVEGDEGDWPACSESLAEAMRLYADAQHEAGIADVLALQAFVAQVNGDDQRLRALTSELRHHAAHTGNAHALGIALNHEGEIALGDDRLASAFEHLFESLRLLEEYEDDQAIADCLESIVYTLFAAGRRRSLAVLLGGADSLRRTIGAAADPRSRERRERLFAELAVDLGGKLCEEALRAGGRLSRHEVVDLAAAEAALALDRQRENTSAR